MILIKDATFLISINEFCLIDAPTHTNNIYPKYIYVLSLSRSKGKGILIETKGN